MTKRLDNAAFVKRMMTISNHGALKQAFILEAIKQYAEKWSEPVTDENNWDNGLVNAHTWYRIAVETRNELKERGL